MARDARVRSGKEAEEVRLGAKNIQMATDEQNGTLYHDICVRGFLGAHPGPLKGELLVL